MHPWALAMKSDALSLRLAVALRDLRARASMPNRPGAPEPPVPEHPHMPEPEEPRRFPIHPEIPTQPIHEPVREPIEEPPHTPVEGP